MFQLMFCGCVVQSTIDDVEALRKRHEDFAKALHGQDDKMKALDELADRLIRDGHPDAALYVPLIYNLPVEVKVKASHTRYRAFGPELIQVYRQSAHSWLFIYLFIFFLL